MNGKTIGIIVLAVAVLLVIIGIRGTQNAIFPFLPNFASSSSSSDKLPPTATPGSGTPGTPSAGQGTPGGCPKGYHSVVVGGRYPTCQKD